MVSLTLCMFVVILLWYSRHVCCHCCVELCAQEISSDGCDLWTNMKSFSTYNYCAAIATPINAMSFRSLWSKLAAQESVQSYLTQAQTYSSHTVQVFAIGFLKLCACIGLTFLAYSSQKDFLGTEESFLNTHFWLSKKNHQPYLSVPQGGDIHFPDWSEIHIAVVNYTEKIVL